MVPWWPVRVVFAPAFVCIGWYALIRSLWIGRETQREMRRQIDEVFAEVRKLDARVIRGMDQPP
jgi:hypothetical protein